MRIETIRWGNFPSQYIDPRPIDIWWIYGFCRPM